jgi:hypothetical protein
MLRRKPLLFGPAGITLVSVCKGALNSQNLDETKGGYRISGAFFLFYISIIFSVFFCLHAGNHANANPG